MRIDLKLGKRQAELKQTYKLIVYMMKQLAVFQRILTVNFILSENDDLEIYYLPERMHGNMTTNKVKEQVQESVFETDCDESWIL